MSILPLTHVIASACTKNGGFDQGRTDFMTTLHPVDDIAHDRYTFSRLSLSMVDPDMSWLTRVNVPLSTISLLKRFMCDHVAQ
jgi:hypothetical protein